MTWEVVARCANCDDPYQSGQIPTRPKLNSQKLNARLWAESHYGSTGHHRFVLEVVEHSTFDVAKIRDPNQLRLSDDPNYSTMTLGSHGSTSE